MNICVAADGRPVAVGDLFHPPEKPAERFRVDRISDLFVFLKPDGWPAAPRVPKRWKFADKGWVRIEEKTA